MGTGTEKFECWAIIELFGHSKIAGFCYEQSIAGGNMLRVDVPETNDTPAFTKLYGNAAIYSINPVDEAICRHMAGKMGVRPVEAYSTDEVIRKKQIAIEGPKANAEEQRIINLMRSQGCIDHLAAIKQENKQAFLLSQLLNDEYDKVMDTLPF